LLPLLFLLCAGLFAQTADTSAPKDASGVRVMHVLGLEGVKRNLRGTLTAQPSGLDFKAGGAHGTVAIASIQDVFTAQDSHQVGGKVLTLAKMGVPYGGGRALSLFTHEKVDSLTVQYRDPNGGLHGVVFTMPLGKAEVLKKQLVVLGAHASIPVASQPEKSDAGGTKQ
jgi:hypothetical protein